MARVLKWRRCAREQLVRDKEWQRDKERGVAERTHSIVREHIYSKRTHTRDKERGVAERYRKMTGERYRASEPRQQ